MLTTLQKYTVQSQGIWERIRRAFAVDPTRSTGVPLNAQFRNPPPGANPPELYDDAVTLPAGDIAENPYYKRDVRRSYPRLSVVSQADAVGLLTVGSRSAPKESVLQIGDAGTRQLAELREEGKTKGLSAFLQSSKPTDILSSSGLPPLPSGLPGESTGHTGQYVLDQESGTGFPSESVIPVHSPLRMLMARIQ